MTNVAVTLGSRKDRREARRRELENACQFLGFGLIVAGGGGLENISPTARKEDPAAWAEAGDTIAEILTAQRPAIIFVPHADDWNRTHIGTHLLVLDALGRMPADFDCLVCETEFWGMMASPNMMVQSSTGDVADLVAALSLHAGEVARNPYHLRLPAWMMDTVRRGGELVGGQGSAAPRFAFATLYRLSRWRAGRLDKAPGPGRVLSCQDDPGGLFDWFEG